MSVSCILSDKTLVFWTVTIWTPIEMGSAAPRSYESISYKQNKLP